MFKFDIAKPDLGMCWRAGLLFFTLLLAGVCQAAAPFTLKPLMQGELASLHVSYLEDATKAYTFEQVQAAEFKPLPDGKSNFGMSASDYWLRIDLLNSGSESLTWFLEAVYPQWDHVSFYMHGEKVQQGGDHHPFARRSVASESNVYEVNTPADSEQSIWVHFSYDLPGLAETQLRLWTPDAFNHHYANRYFMIGAIVGIGLLLVFYNLFIGFSTRMTEFIWYTSYILAAVITLLSLTGLGYRYIWSGSIWLTDFAPILFSGLMLMLATQFTRSFLNTAKESVVIDRLLRFVFVLGGLVLISYLLGWRDVAMKFVVLCALVTVFYPFIGFWLYRKGKSDARYYVIGWSIWSFAVLIGMLRSVAFLPSDFITGFAPATGLIIEGVLLSFALADRINRLRSDKESIESIHIEHLEKQQQVLEQLVGERTAELELARDRAELLARRDVLTSTLNRRAFFECGETEIERGLRYRTPLAVMMIDLDHFKSINDNYGHAAGDAVLIAAVALLQGMIRNMDVIGRIGGEEFAILLPHADQQAATELAERLRLGLEGLEICVGDLQLKVTACFGVTAIDVTSESLDDAMKRADKALYLAKENGRNRVELAGDVDH